ncbi:MAG: FimV family protein [Gammaproteobacteria bacterium]|nr:FimV family protein [Gammaproteobacteria bacterium]
MVRKLSLAIALALGVTPFAASALGLGDIESTSALNQQFNGSIKLLSLQDEEIEDIRVSIASTEVFQKAGIERPHFLSGLKFKPVRLPNGAGLIRVTSNDPIREPFLNFVVEVNWPKGRLFREYTVLLDPPVTLGRAAVSVKPATITPRSITTRQVAPPGPATTMAPRVQDGADGEYGPIRRNETLWSIAQQLRPRGATVEQTMMALFRANPHAFIANNINNLRVGEILRVPGREDVTSMTPQAARVAFRDQLENWRRPQPLVDQPESEKPLMTDTPADQAPVDEVVEPEVLPEAELKIAGVQSDDDSAKADTEGAEGITTDTEQLERDLMVAREVRESALAEGQELKTRIQSLESQLEDLQRLLELKDEQLARLQDTLAGGTSDATLDDAAGTLLEDAEPEVTVVTEPPTAADAPELTEEQVVTPTPEEEAVAQEQSDTSEKQQEVLQMPGDMPTDTAEIAGVDPALDDTGMVIPSGSEEPDAASEAGTTETLMVDAPEAETVIVEQSPPQSSAQVPTESVPTEVEAPKPSAQEPSTIIADSPPAAPAPVAQSGPMELLKKLTGDTTLMALAGGGLLLLVALFWLLISRRRAGNEEFQESILVDTIQDDDSDDMGSVADTLPDGRRTEETSFLSDFSPSDIDVLQDETGEVDPVSEADVYIAYGRYGQAEELIRQAIEKDPQRMELKRKLFDILYATKNKAAFTTLAEEALLANMPKTDGVGWKAVVGMGSELAPDHRLFSRVGGDTGNHNSDPTVRSADPGNLEDLDLDELTADLESDDELSNALDDAGEIDLKDLGLDDDALEVELDLDTLSSSEKTPNLDQSKLGDQRLSLEESDGIAQSQSAEQETKSDDVEAYSLEDLGPDELDNTVVDFAVRPDKGVLAADEERLELPDMDDQGATVFPDFLSQGTYDADEVNTKLDLAKAYVEMGDAEGARGILDEVLSEGSDTQKQQAQQILSALG